MDTGDVGGTPLRRAGEVLRGLGCSPSEVLALALLAAAAVAGLGLLWWSAHPAVAPEGSTPTEDVAAADPAVHADEAGGGLDVRQGTVVVHVAGRVQAPGLYELPGGARVADALAAAGGTLPDALLDHLNLARPLNDGEQLRVPGPDDVAPPGGPVGGDVEPGAGAGGGPPGGPSAWRPDGLLDLNLASAADLQELPGIGPVLAERVVAHREQHGPFTSVGELRQISGIGERIFQGLADLVAV